MTAVRPEYLRVSPQPVTRPPWYRQGRHPDYRFSLANERTFLAWIRTALAILAAGVLLDQLSTKLRPQALVVSLAGALCLLAGSLCVLAYARWKQNEIAMRHEQPLPISRALGLLAAGVFSCGIALGILVLRAKFHVQ